MVSPVMEKAAPTLAPGLGLRWPWPADRSVLVAYAILSRPDRGMAGVRWRLQYHDRTGCGQGVNATTLQRQFGLFKGMAVFEYQRARRLRLALRHRSAKVPA